MNVPARGSVLALPLVFLVLFLNACDIVGASDTTLRDQLNRAEEQWRQTRPASYTMTMSIATLVREVPWVAHVTVVNGQVASVTDPLTGEPFTGNPPVPFQSVEGVFDLVREAISLRVPNIHVRYDAEFAYPEHVEVDYDVRRLDDNLLVSISEFTPAP